MLTVNPAQMKALSDAQRRRFEEKLAAHLQDKVGDAAPPPDTLTTLVDAALDAGTDADCDVAHQIARAAGAPGPGGVGGFANSTQYDDGLAGAFSGKAVGSPVQPCGYAKGSAGAAGSGHGASGSGRDAGSSGAAQGSGSAGSGPPSPTSAGGGPASSTDPTLHWIEIELIGEDDRPVANETYRITLPDGSVTTGRLDSNGRARVDGLAQAGQCQITFPNLDESAWEAL